MIELSPDGSIYISKADIMVSPGYYVFNDCLPDRFDIPDQPLGGITAFEPENSCRFAEEGMEETKRMIESRAPPFLPGGNPEELQTVFNTVRWALGQLELTTDTLYDAIERKKIDEDTALRAVEILDRVNSGPLSRAYHRMLRNCDNPRKHRKNMKKVKNELERSSRALTRAMRQLVCLD